MSCSHGGMMAQCSLAEVYQHFAPENGLFKDLDSFALPCSYRFTQGSTPAYNHTIFFYAQHFCLLS